GGGSRKHMAGGGEKFWGRGDPADYEPRDEFSCAAIAAREGRTPDEVAYDYLTEAENRYLFFPVVNYVYGDHEPIREMLTDSATLLGLSDGGAQCASIGDAGVPAYLLLHLGRDRRRGRDCRSNCWSSARPARRRISSACGIAVD